MRKRRPTCDSDFSAIAVPSMHGSGYLDYAVETHASRCLKAMEEFRRLGMLCDLVLRVSHKDKTAAFKVRAPHTVTHGAHRVGMQARQVATVPPKARRQEWVRWFWREIARRAPIGRMSGCATLWHG